MEAQAPSGMWLEFGVARDGASRCPCSIQVPCLPLPVQSATVTSRCPVRAHLFILPVTGAHRRRLVK